ncbi:MAG: beta-ketoacyl-[acyl-carrier-protein] synthase family protein [Deltaproteobacteria bacterium]|nr:beta-ketoacyl-[acyl-carrier-protein] synthase family protein [Deltaproteobacteria bacterium]
MSRRVFVTGMGVVSSVGIGRRAFWESLVAGRSGASLVEGFDAARSGRDRAAQVHGFRASEHLTREELPRLGRCAAMAVASARMALEDAGLAPGALAGPRTSVVLGTTMGEADLMAREEARWIHQGRHAIEGARLAGYGTSLLSVHVARAVGSRGAVLALPAACAAGNYALGFASDLLREGLADVVLAGASELLQDLQYYGFVRLGAVAPERIQPFDLNRQGLLVGEGAAVLVLESEAHAARRGATPLAELGGYGVACDAFHITRPHPEGQGNVHALREALWRSGIGPEAVDFVNAHGTATRANDAVEARSLKAVFGERRVPVSSVKSMIGHCMGAASALEAVSCVETVRTGILPPTIHYETPDPECDLDIVANAARHARADVVVNNALAFGGYDAVLVVARPGCLPEPPGPEGARP